MSAKDQSRVAANVLSSAAVVVTDKKNHTRDTVNLVRFLDDSKAGKGHQSGSGQEVKRGDGTEPKAGGRHDHDKVELGNSFNM
jgi:hypothetical protein